MCSEKYDATNKLGLGYFHLDPRWTTYDEFDWLVERGYINTLRLSTDSLSTTIAGAQKIAEFGGKVWLSIPEYSSERENLSEFMRKVDAKMKRLAERGVDNIIGFLWDEPMGRVSNRDFHEMTRELTKEYGLRLNAVFSAYEIMGVRGNMQDPDGTIMLQQYATEYLTDIGYDSYGYDFRKPYTEKQIKKFAEMSEKHPGISSTETYYNFYFNALKDRLANKNTNIWVYPCAYTTPTWAGIVADEDYCIAHLKGLTKLLLEQEHPGGIMCYSFKTWSKNEKGADILLSRHNPERWEKFEQALRDTFEQIKNMEIR